jgi:hypothetical protein
MSEPSFGDRVDSWLHDGPQFAPPDLLASVTDDVARTTPARYIWPWRRFGDGVSTGRSYEMSRFKAGVVAVGAAAIVLSVGSALLATQVRPDVGIRRPDGTNPATTVGSGLIGFTADLSLDLTEGGRSLDPGVPIPLTRSLEGGTWSGAIEVTTAGRNLRGEMRLDMHNEIEPTPTGPAVNHGWGSATGSLDGELCDGSIAFSYYRGGPAAGTFFLRCTDDAIMGGQVLSVDVSPTESGWLLTARINGTYRDGG